MFGIIDPGIAFPDGVEGVMGPLRKSLIIGVNPTDLKKPRRSPLVPLNFPRTLPTLSMQAPSPCQTCPPKEYRNGLPGGSPAAPLTLEKLHPARRGIPGRSYRNDHLTKGSGMGK